ncbi:MAG: alpha/beta fold hydrolase [Steroidobacter sp.]
MSEATLTLRIVANDGVELVADIWNPTGTPTLLLLPAGGEVRNVWRKVVANLTTDVMQRWRIIAADHRGHGDSGRSPAYRFAHLFDDLQCWIRALSAKPLVVGGGSIGGALALVAAGEGACIDGVVLLDVPTVPVLEKALGERRRMIGARVTDHPAMRSVDPNFTRSGFIEDVFQDADRWRRAAVSLRAPILLIGGETGAIGPMQLEQYREHAPHGEFARLATGHLVARDDPEGVARLLSGFLAAHFGRSDAA